MTGLDGILLGSAVPLTVAAIVVLYGALRTRRSGETPHCSECDYALVGLAALANCPECGASLAGEGAVAIGDVVDQRRRALVGWTLMLLAVGCAAACAVRASSDVAWIEYQPFAWLLRDLDRSADVSGPAWDEIQRRWDAKELSVGQSSRLIERCLAEQVATRTPPHPQLAAMMKLLESACVDGRVSPAQEQRFVDAATEVRLVVVPAGTDGSGAVGPPTIRLACEGNGPGKDSALVRTSLFDRLECDGHRAPLPLVAAMRSSLGAPERETIPLPPRATTPGHHRLRVVLATSVLPKYDSSVSRPYRRAQELSAEYEVPAPPPEPRWEAEPAAWFMATHVAAERLTFARTDAGRFIRGTIEVTRPPVNLAVEVYTEVAGSTVWLGTVRVPRGATATISLEANLGLTPVPRQVDLRFTSSASAAGAGKPLFTEAWQGEFEIHGVPITAAATTQP